VEDKRALEEFVDVASEEKYFMHLWNCFVFQHPIYSDGYTGVGCKVGPQPCSTRMVSYSDNYTGVGRKVGPQPTDTRIVTLGNGIQGCSKSLDANNTQQTLLTPSLLYPLPPHACVR
jgi:hypothetical protein